MVATPNTNGNDKNGEIIGTLKITVLPKSDGLYVCQLSRSFNGFPTDDISCDGQTPEHALAIGFEQLASEYRQKVEESQNIPSMAVEKTAAGKVIEKHFHVTVHYECILEEESIFLAHQAPLMGNLLAEDSQVTVIAVDPALQVEKAVRWIKDEEDED